MIKKLNPNHLKRLLNNECDVNIYQEGLSEEGEPLTSLNLKKQKCRFVEKPLHMHKILKILKSYCFLDSKKKFI